MATIDTNIDVNRNFTIHTVIGEVLHEEIEDKIKIYSESGPTEFVLWDFSKAELSKINSSHINYFVYLTSQYSSYRKGGKTAFVVSSELGFGFGRIFDTLQDAMQSKIPYMTFRDKENALKWLFG
jgi:hypothetical protein